MKKVKDFLGVPDLLEHLNVFDSLEVNIKTSGEVDNWGDDFKPQYVWAFSKPILEITLSKGKVMSIENFDLDITEVICFLNGFGGEGGIDGKGDINKVISNKPFISYLSDMGLKPHMEKDLCSGKISLHIKNAILGAGTPAQILAYLGGVEFAENSTSKCVFRGFERLAQKIAQRHVFEKESLIIVDKKSTVIKKCTQCGELAIVTFNNSKPIWNYSSSMVCPKGGKV